MAETYVLEVASPDRVVLHEAVREAQIPAAAGYIGVLPGHAAYLSQLGIGELSYVLAGGERHTVAVSGGFVEVLGSHVRVLADSAERASEIDMARAEEAMKRAAERLSHPEKGVDIARALNAMRRAQTRLGVAGTLKLKKH